MATGADIPRIDTGLPRLDEILAGGLPARSVTVLAGPPGAGKTILAQQICFHLGAPTSRALYFSLSEPTAKTLLYAARFAFFDAAKLEAGVQFIDLGSIAGTGGLEEAAGEITAHVERARPALVVVDGFRVFDELARSRDDLRRLAYEITVKLMVWECTALVLGEYGAGELEHNPLVSVVDGLVLLRHRRASGKRQRVIEVVKMRGTAHDCEPHPFVITPGGIEILAADGAP